MKHYPLARRVITAFVALIIVPFILLTCYSEIGFSNNMNQHILINAGLLADQYILRLDSKFEKMESLVNQIKIDEDLRTVIGDSQNSRTNGDTYLALQAFRDNINKYMNTFDGQAYSICLTNMRSIVLQMINTHFNTLPNTLTEQEWFINTLARRGALYWGGIESQLKSAGSLISVSSAIYGKGSVSIVGTLNVAFDADSIFPAHSDPDSDDVLLFYRPDTGAAYSKSAYRDDILAAAGGIMDGSADSSSVTLDGQEYYMVGSNLGDYGWMVLYATPAGRMLETVYTNTMVFIATSIICLVLIVAFMLHLQTRLISPLESAIEFINENTMHKVAIRSDAHGYPEIRMMKQRAVSLVRDKQDAELSLQQMSAQKDMAQMKTLQMQINPHFLYNTLNSIKILADTGRAQDVSQLILHLIHLLSACMDRSGLSITVHQEVENLNHYFAIQQTVYGDTVRFIEDMREELDDCEIPNFILQPIVENSLQHGVDQSKPDNWVKVSNRADGETLIFEIEDNGVGMPPDKLLKIERELRTATATPSAHIGICSVHRRIQLSCGAEYGISISSTPGAGSRFTIRLPLN